MWIALCIGLTARAMSCHDLQRSVRCRMFSANDAPDSPGETILGSGWSRSGQVVSPVVNNSLTLQIREMVVLKRIRLEFTVPIEDAKSK